MTERDYKKGLPCVTTDGFGYMEGYDDRNNGRPWSKPVLVQFGGDTVKYYAEADVRLATIWDFLFNANGFGKVPWFRFLGIALSTAFVIWSVHHNGYGWWGCTFLVWVPAMVYGQRKNFKGLQG